jgi:hypothetical protein
MAFGLSAGALGAIGSIGGALIGANAAGNAADTQAAAADRASQTQWDMYNQNRTDQAPYRQAGYSSLAALMNGMGLTPAQDQPMQGGMYSGAAPQGYQQLRDMLAPQYTTQTAGGSDMSGNPIMAPTVDEQGLNAAIQAQMAQQQPRMQASPSGEPGQQGPGFGDLNRSFTLADFQKDPGYQFRMDEGAQGLERSAAARGGLMNGGSLKALERYRQGFASNEFNNAFNRDQADKTSRFNRLSSLAGIGQTSANQVGQMGMNTANQVSNNQLSQANAQAAGQVGSANAISGGLQSIGNWWQQQNALKGSGSSGGISGLPSWAIDPYGG